MLKRKGWDLFAGKFLPKNRKDLHNLHYHVHLFMLEHFEKELCIWTDMDYVYGCGFVVEYFVQNGVELVLSDVTRPVLIVLIKQILQPLLLFLRQLTLQLKSTEVMELTVNKTMWQIYCL